jgi:ABC-type sulfate transport system substrate-binding protein
MAGAGNDDPNASTMWREAFKISTRHLTGWKATSGDTLSIKMSGGSSKQAQPYDGLAADVVTMVRTRTSTFRLSREPGCADGGTLPDHGAVPSTFYSGSIWQPKRLIGTTS